MWPAKTGQDAKTGPFPGKTTDVIKKRKQYSTDFKAKWAFAAIKEMETDGGAGGPLWPVPDADQ